MAIQRIAAIILSYLYIGKTWMSFFETLFWPVVDIGFYGLMALWMSDISGQPSLLQIFVVCLFLWQVIYRANFEICLNILHECWSQNIFNLLSSPLSILEWIIAIVTNSLIKLVFVINFGAALAWIMFHINIFTIGWILLPFLIMCIFTGWSIGFFTGALIIRYGLKLQQMPWIIISFISLFSTINHPLSILPYWMGFIAQIFPMTYIFEGIRNLIQTNSVPYVEITKGTSLSFIYFLFSLSFFTKMIQKKQIYGMN